MRSRIVLFCSEDHVSQVLCDTKPVMFSVTQVENKTDFHSSFVPTDGAVVFVKEADAPRVIPEVVTVAKQFPLKPLIIAARRGTRVMSCLGEYIEVPSPVDTHTGRYIWDEYYYAWVRARLYMLSLGLSQTGLSAHLQNTLTCALRSATPVVSVTGLVSLTGVNRKTLWRHWDAEVLPRWPVRLLDVLDWIALIHFVARKTPDRTWASLALWAGVDVRTLSRQAKKLTGHTLSELGGLDKEDVFRAFADQMGQLFAVQSVPRAD